MTALRLLVAALVPLSPDEAYYWVWSRSLAAGYLDHPPMVALFIRAGTALAGQGALGVRLLSPLAAGLGTLLLARAAEDVFPGRRAGVRAALLLNATLLLGVGSVTATPDTPLLLFWTATIAALARLHATGHGRWWLAAGLCGGVALDSKYTAVLLAPAILAWLLADKRARRWLVTPWPWLAAAVAAAAFVPVLAWNARHHWASFAKQGGRMAAIDPARALTHLGELLAGQIGLATPGIAVLFVLGVAGCCRRDIRALPAALTLLPAAVFVQHALGDRVQANWPAIVYPAAALAASTLDTRGWHRPAIALGVAATAAVWLQAVAAPLPLGRLDPTLRLLAGWDGLARELAELARREHAGVAADNYGLVSALARTLPAKVPVIGVEPRWALFDLPSAATAGPLLLLRSARRNDPPPGGQAPIATLVRSRDGVPAETYRVFRLPPGAASAGVLLPRPIAPSPTDTRTFP